jgi:hypothetical protein
MYPLIAGVLSLQVSSYCRDISVINNQKVNKNIILTSLLVSSLHGDHYNDPNELDQFGVNMVSNGLLSV